MDRKEIVDNIAPCGLACYKCVGFKYGEVKKHSDALEGLLENFDAYAEKFSGFMPVYKKYPEFKEVLKVFSGAACEGCRSGECKFPGCGVAPCIKEKGIDFCHQCENFPCGNMDANPDLKERWIRMNSRMREIGIEEYYKETKKKPRYEKRA